MRILVEKAKRRLTVRQGRALLFRCKVQLGRQPTGRKTAEGDGRTPEGRYFICSRNPKSKFHRSLGISYPNADDARAAGVDPEIVRQIESADRRHVRPPWDTPLGGWIMLHGQRDEHSVHAGDWTAGCIAVANEDMDWLFLHISGGATVIIRA